MVKISLEQFSKVRVLVAGDVMLDRYLFGDTNRISPEAPVSVVQIDMVVWNKILPLNKIINTPEFVRKNLFKILYDVCKGLHVLHSINLIHNDAVLDNIGIQNNKFVLFDFDGTGRPEEKGKTFDNDYKTLQDSVKYVLGQEIKITGIGSVIEMVSKINKISIPEAFESLEIMRIA